MTDHDPGRLGHRYPALRRIVYAAVTVYAAATVAALAAWAVVGDTWWTQPLNLTTFWWTLPAVVAAPAAWLLRRRALAVLLLIPALTWVWSYGTAFLPKDVAAADGEVVRIASFNTYVQTPDASHVLQLVEEEEVDVMLLAEVFPDRQAELERALGDRFPTMTFVSSAGVGAVAVLSRYPLVEVRDVGEASENSRHTAVVVIDVDGTPVQVVPVHLLSPCPSCGQSLAERIEFEGDVRRAEMAAVLAALDDQAPAIVGGDFNSTDRSEPYRRLTRAGFRDPQREAGSGLGFTWPNDGRLGPVFRIDWLLTRGLEPVDAFVGDGGPSDHRPVLVDVRVGEG